MSVITSADDLSEYLSDINRAGTEPVVVGFDGLGAPFLAYGWAPGGDGWAPGGDGWDCGIVQGDPHSAEFDYSDGTGRCEECGAFDRRGIEKLFYPVTIVRAPDTEVSP